MSRYRGPRVKIIRRLGPLPGFTSKTSQSKSNLSNQASIKKKISQYRIRLEEKQKLRFHYGLTERQLLRYVYTARKTKGSTGQTLLQLLEMRLDNTVFRLGMARTIPAARQLVSHGHIAVNGKIVNIPSYGCKPTNLISVRARNKSRTLIENNLNISYKSTLSNHLSINTVNQQATVNQIIDRESINLQINELLVVEYYSRQG
jgi:small subunit ribosomal protein S4